jgi:hypothetical protein
MRHFNVRISAELLKTKILTAMAITGVAVVGISSLASAASQSVVYNNIPSPMPSNVASIGYEATSTSEFGSQVNLDGTARKNPKVTVLMSSWACKSGSWFNKDCITNPGSTFTHPVTLNVYNVNDDDSVGSLIKSDTDTFTMPYRPTADDGTNCNAANDSAGEWWDGSKCVNGKAFKISFDLDNMTLPDEVIISVAYNTSDYGKAPLGPQACKSTPQGCPYDSLNVGTNPAPSVGTSEPSNDDAYLSSTWAGYYCDSGVSGTGTFRLDSGCWTGYLPAIKVEASPGKSNNSNHHHHHKHYDGNKDQHKKYKNSQSFYDL